MKQRVNHSTGEREAVRTTIVGGRPPGSGRDNGSIPRGMEVLIKKAAVDPEFRSVLLEKRTEAANLIGLELTPSEAAMMKTIPERQLLSIVSHTDVPDRERRVFLGKAAAAMLGVLGAGVAGSCREAYTAGIKPDKTRNISKGIEPDVPDKMPVTDGIRPDVPDESGERVTQGVRPDVPKNVPAPTGIRPDVPPKPVAGVRPVVSTNKPKADEKKAETPPPAPPKKKILYSRGVRPDIPRKTGE